MPVTVGDAATVVEHRAFDRAGNTSSAGRLDVAAAPVTPVPTTGPTTAPTTGPTAPTTTPGKVRPRVKVKVRGMPRAGRALRLKVTVRAAVQPRGRVRLTLREESGAKVRQVKAKLKRIRAGRGRAYITVPARLVETGQLRAKVVYLGSRKVARGRAQLTVTIS